MACVQETKFRDATHLSNFKFHLESSFQHKLFVNDTNCRLVHPTRGRTSGVFTIFRSDFPGFNTAAVVETLSVPSRYLVVKLTIEDTPVYVHNVYAPVDRQEKERFFNGLDADRFEDDATHFVLGDLNTSLDPSLDSSRPNRQFDPSRSSCLAWLAKLGVVDAWRIHHAEQRIFTGPMPRKNRLDYILMSASFCDHYYGDSTYFQPKHAGDHLAHAVRFRTGSQLHGRGYWKFPRYLLDYPLVVAAIEKEADLILVKLRSSLHPGKLWEKWKRRIKYMLQAMQQKLRAQDNAVVEEARAALEHAAARHRDSHDADSRYLYEEAMSTFKDTVLRTSQYNQDSAFDFQAANAEKSTKHFFRPLDTSLRRVSIEEVMTPSGSVSTNPLEISLQFMEHWGSQMGDLTSANGTAARPDSAKQRTLLDSIVRTASEDARAALTSPLTVADLAGAIRHMKAGSAPGMDGLTAGFYQLAPDTFGECLLIVFNDQLRQGMLLPSQRRSAVVLLHKKGSRADPGNYRPIALIPVDVKVLSKALTRRLQALIPDLVHDDQKGFIKGRSIHHHVRFLADLQDLVTGLDDDAYALFLDFEKAFDRVNWNYMFLVLERMGCGSEFVQWVKLLYTSPQAHLIINGHVLPALSPTRGVKQGDPLSALLFVLTIEPLGNLLRSHEEHGVCLTDDHTATGVFFADDTTLLGGTVAGIQAQLQLVEDYCKGSGAKLNLNKSTLMALNRTRDCPRLPGMRVLARSESVKFLGIPFSQSPVNDAIVAFLEQRFYDGFKLWYRRARTLFGRLLVAQTMVLSRLWHYTQHVTIPDALVKRWQSLLNRFVLSRKYERESTHVQLIPKEFLYLRKSEGGLRIPSISAQLKRQRLQLVLQFVEMARLTTIRSWTTPGTVVLNRVLPAVGGSAALDFLVISPLRHGELLRWSKTSKWWKTTWTWWYKIQWPITWHDLPADERILHAFNQPVWFNADPELHFEQAPQSVNASAHRRCLGMVPEPQRSFRLHVSRIFTIRSLADFQNADSSWPTEREFVLRYRDYTLSSVSIGMQTRWLRRLHTEASQIAQRLNPGNATIQATADNVLPYLGCTSGLRTCLLPAIPRCALLRLVWSPTPPTKPHPMSHHAQNVDQQVITQYVKFGKYLREILLPVFADLQFRLAFRLLPVRSRFWFLRDVNPRIMYCIREGCNAIESERHLFFECILASQIWEHLGKLMAPVFRSAPSWTVIITAQKPAVPDAWKPHEQAIGDIWHIFRAVALHFIWIDRNRCLFDGRLPTPPSPALLQVFSTASAHFRHNLRHRYDQTRQASFRQVLSTLSCYAPFGDFVATHHHAFRIRNLDQ